MRPDAWTRAGESGLMARLVALQLVAGQQLESVTADHGIALGDYLVLAVIRRSPDEVCAPSTICDVLRRATGGMTLTLDRLQTAGWLTREPDPSDRRRVCLRLTAAGSALAVSVNDALHQWERSIAPAHRLQPLVDAVDELLDLLDLGETVQPTPEGSGRAAREVRTAAPPEFSGP
jgi:DNA-binding MarR family transcriptional regulator